MVLVRPDDATDMAIAVIFGLSTAGPKPGGLQEVSGTGVAEEGRINGRLPVVPNCIGHVRTDVLLLLAAEHINGLSILANDLVRRRLVTCIRQFPAYMAPRQPIRAAFARAPFKVL